VFVEQLELQSDVVGQGARSTAYHVRHVAVEDPIVE
jgi:hypothetical protein